MRRSLQRYLDGLPDLRQADLDDQHAALSSSVPELAQLRALQQPAAASPQAMADAPLELAGRCDCSACDDRPAACSTVTTGAARPAAVCGPCYQPLSHTAPADTVTV